MNRADEPNHLKDKSEQLTLNEEVGFFIFTGLQLIKFYNEEFEKMNFL